MGFVFAQTRTRIAFQTKFTDSSSHHMVPTDGLKCFRSNRAPPGGRRNKDLSFIFICCNTQSEEWPDNIQITDTPSPRLYDRLTHRVFLSPAPCGCLVLCSVGLIHVSYLGHKGIIWVWVG